MGEIDEMEVLLYLLFQRLVMKFGWCSLSILPKELASICEN